MLIGRARSARTLNEEASIDEDFYECDDDLLLPLNRSTDPLQSP